MYIKNIIKVKSSVEPKLILWDPAFTSINPFYRVAVRAETTMSDMAEYFLGTKLTKEQKQSDLLLLPVPNSSVKVYLGTWEKFLEVANREQRRYVQRTLKRVLGAA